MSKKKCFVKTKDIEVKESLEKQGFEYIGIEDGLYVFLNNGGNFVFDKDKQGKYIETDLLAL